MEHIEGRGKQPKDKYLSQIIGVGPVSAQYVPTAGV